MHSLERCHADSTAGGVGDEPFYHVLELHGANAVSAGYCSTQDYVMKEVLGWYAYERMLQMHISTYSGELCNSCLDRPTFTTSQIGNWKDVDREMEIQCVGKGSKFTRFVNLVLITHSYNS